MVTRHRFTIDVHAVAPAGVETLVGDVHVPDAIDGPVVLVCCLPGGGMARQYFDLQVPAEAGNYSMATHLARAGFVVITLDHPGVGESDRPDDGYTLLPRTIADVDAFAVAAARRRLAAGTLVPALAPLAIETGIGVGHSAGAIVTVHLQARHRPYDALVLLGFGGRGWREKLTEDELAVADDPEVIHERLPALAAQRFGEALPMPKRGSSPLLVAAPMHPDAHAALVGARTNMLGVLGLSSMIPGSLRPDIDAVDVPVFVGVGERDIAGPPREIPASLTGSNDITLFVLPGAGHNHNVHADREVLWDRVAAWMRAIAAA